MGIALGYGDPQKFRRDRALLPGCFKIFPTSDYFFPIVGSQTDRRLCVERIGNLTTIPENAQSIRRDRLRQIQF